MGDGYHRHPPGRNGGTRRCHRIGAEDRQGFLPYSNPHRPTDRSRPARPPPTTMRHRGCAVTHAASLRTPTRGQEDRREAPRGGRSSTEAEREGTTSTAVVREARTSGTVAVAVRTRQQGMPGHPWPGQARNGPAKPRRHAAASRRWRRQHPAAHRLSPAYRKPRSRHTPPPARPGLDGPRRAKIWAEREPPDRAAVSPRRQRRCHRS